jgi:hypothetical protein
MQPSFAAYLSNHLKRYGVKMDLTIYQTDNSSRVHLPPKEEGGGKAPFEVWDKAPKNPSKIIYLEL